MFYFHIRKYRPTYVEMANKHYLINKTGLELENHSPQVMLGWMMFSNSVKEERS